MTKILQLLPIKVLIKLVLDLLKFITSKTSNKWDDQVVKYLEQMYTIIQQYIPQKTRYKKQ